MAGEVKSVVIKKLTKPGMQLLNPAGASTKGMVDKKARVRELSRSLLPPDQIKTDSNKKEDKHTKDYELYVWMGPAGY